MMHLFNSLVGTFSIMANILSTIASKDTCPVARYTGRFNESDHVKDRALFGRSYKNLSTDTALQCFSVCSQDCRCASYQLSGRRCELLDESRNSTPDLFQPMSGYKYYEMKQQFRKSTSVGCSSQCNNGCCRYPQPCLNGGTCIETCQNVTHKFQCACPEGFGGRVCQIPISPAENSTTPVSNIYPIETNSGTVMAFCDMTSEPGMVWTLIESFAFSERSKFREAPLTDDVPSNEENPPNWSDYRMSRNTMQHVKRHATHWRATCNYDTAGLIKTDYIRGRLSELDILTYIGQPLCAKVEYINVRGISCQDCTSHFRQGNDLHVFVDSGQGVKINCQWDGTSGSINGKCDNFGRYTITNTAHRCSSSSSSTTQWWLGKTV